MPKRFLVLLLIVTLMLPGCAYYKNTLLRVKADRADADAPLIEGMPKVNIGRGNAVMNRGVYFGFGLPIPKLHDVVLIEQGEDKEGKPTKDSASITKNAITQDVVL